MQLAEAGAAVAAGGDDHLVDLLRHGVQIEADPVLAAVGRGCLAEQLHAAAAYHGVVVEAEVVVAADLAVAVEQEDGDVRVALPVALLQPRPTTTEPTFSLSAVRPTLAPLTISCTRPPDAQPLGTHPAARCVTCVVRHTFVVRSEH